MNTPSSEAVARAIAALERISLLTRHMKTASPDWNVGARDAIHELANAAAADLRGHSNFADPSYRYFGYRRGGRGLAQVDVGVDLGAGVTPPTTRLEARQDLFNHSPDGFEWGYQGSGPAQLALAILAHATGVDELAVKHHQVFKSLVIAAIPSGTASWELTSTTVRAWVDAIERGEGMPDGWLEHCLAITSPGIHGA